MTIRNLDRLFAPKSVALFGASDRPSSVGAVLARNLRAGGYAGRLMYVNPKHVALDGEPCHPDVGSLPVVPDLAVIATPPDTVPGLVAALGARGTKAVVVITAGFGEGTAARGGALRQAMLDAARPHMLRIVGPNCLGVMVPARGLNATFAHLGAQPGKLAFVAQSGAVLAGVLDWASARDVGFSHLVSVGDMADVDFGDLLDYLALDPGTSAILLHVEAVTHARKFMSAARAAARLKPVVVLKAGRHEEGARAVASHTGALAGADAVHEAAFRRAGMLRVRTLQELFDAVEILARSTPIAGDRVAILTNGGGFGVLAADALIDEGGRLADLSPETLARLDTVLPATWSRANPVDIIGDAPGRRYADALAALLDDRGIDAILVLNCPTAIASSVEAARAVSETMKTRPRIPVIAGWMGDSVTVIDARRTLEAARLPVYGTPEEAARGVMHLVHHRRSREALMETPPSVPEDFVPDHEAARRVIAGALRAGRKWLTGPEAGSVLAAYGIPVAAERVASTAADAVATARAIGHPVALKILSADITHKSDVGGVALDLEDDAQVHAAAERMLARVWATAPAARVDGFSVQGMVRRPRAHELIVGLTEDAQFGPVVLFGQGGTATEIVADRAIALPPLNMRLALDLIGQTRVHRLLRGYRDRPAADLDAVALVLVKIAQLAADLAEVAELDINPLLADEDGVIALDARMRVAAFNGRAEERLAIRPYPNELEEEVSLADARRLWLRPVRPEDEPALAAAFHKFSPEAVRLRFFTPLKHLTHQAAARLTQLDYDREMAFVAVSPKDADAPELYALGGIAADPDNEQAEFAVMVRDDVAGLGLGSLLMRRLIDYGRKRGLRELVGHVLGENSRMLRICHRLDFKVESDVATPWMKEVRLPLQVPADR